MLEEFITPSCFDLEAWFNTHHSIFCNRVEWVSWIMCLFCKYRSGHVVKNRSHKYCLNFGVFRSTTFSFAKLTNVTTQHRSVCSRRSAHYCQEILVILVILVNNQLDAQFFSVYVYFDNPHVSSNHVLIIRWINFINTTSGICHLHTVTNTRCRIDKIGSPDYEHMIARNMWSIEINIHGKELCVKLVIYKNYTEMHGQENIKFCQAITEDFRIRLPTNPYYDWPLYLHNKIKLHK